MLVSDDYFLVAFVVIRTYSTFFIQSSFVPDEYWQSLEVSHKLAFGYGHLTWEWSKKIRSCFYPFIIHLFYKITPDSPFFIIIFPKLLQSVLSSVGDFFTYKFAKEYFGRSCGHWTAFNILSSWFLFYCSSRTLTNMAEASLTACGLYFYPWPRKRKYRVSSIYIWLAGISVVIRPTAIVTWLPLYIWDILRTRNAFVVIKNSFIAGCVILSMMLFVDLWCYKELVFTPYNFFVFNWSNDIGAFYGTHNILWYFSALPVVLGLQFIPFIFGLMIPQLKQFYLLILWILIILSFPSHKELRFLLPIMHLCMIINGFVMSELWNGRMKLCKIKTIRTVIEWFSVLTVLVSFFFGLYMGLYFKSGVIVAMHYLRENVTDDSSVLFLMPCHSTPYYSYIHKNITMKFLSCEPNFENVANYIEEADNFYDDPYKWLLVHYESDLYESSLPSHIVIFHTLYPSISPFLKRHNYTKCFSTFHAHFARGRVGKYVCIYCK